MRRPLLATMLLAGLVPGLAAAKPWNGIEPGVATLQAVVQKFGEPTKRVAAPGKEVLVYSKDKAIKGSVQAQFRCDAETKIVERIDVYPAVVIEAAAIETAYGPSCEVKPGADPCYLRRESEAKANYYLYSKLGLAVFFNDDGQTVRSMAFLPKKE